ncbi:rho GTPase-activating protein 6-like isoform X2 [Synchiropus splendidus]|uniref:rho GTPase-activating protein 6-like isoform X2 n=1 Tax=Synchiropus splendidus TaxID=270530 RepID=UPI00237D7E7F|nr:rho GTPase-activating protein 6-like isoform X2 [Synchiropus splendidus]
MSADPPLHDTAARLCGRARLSHRHRFDAAMSLVWDSLEELDPDTRQGGFTWSGASGRTVGLKPVPLQSLSELERVRLQDVSFRRLLRDPDLRGHISIPKCGHKSKKSLRRKLDSLSKEKSKDRETLPQAFSIPLWQVIANDHTHKQRQEPAREEHSDPSELMLTFLHLTSSFRRVNRDFSSSNSSLSSASETQNESPLPAVPDLAPRTRRRVPPQISSSPPSHDLFLQFLQGWKLQLSQGSDDPQGGVSVDCITDLDDNQSQLLEALQLSLPAETAGSRKKSGDKKLSLNPIYRQVPRVVELCCQHLEQHALQTVGIFRVGSSKKRVRRLREEFDQGWDVGLEEERSVHDVAALLKEFLRDMPDPLLTRELYSAFISTTLLEVAEQETAIQLLIFLLPPCNCDTLQRLLRLLSSVAAHAGDQSGPEPSQGQGNKMTSVNLATILGPNLLHKQKNWDREFAVQSSARAEESSAVISVVQRMIDSYHSLFTVSADLQNEVLMSLLESDPDVVDYLLRRKDSRGSESGPVTLEGRPLSERCSSDESSGEVSPYDNNSPVQSAGLLTRSSQSRRPSSGSRRRLDRRSRGQCGRSAPDLSKDRGSLGDTSEGESCGSSDGLGSRQGNSKPPVLAAAASLDGAECGPHLPLGPVEQSGRQPGSAPLPELAGQLEAVSSDDPAERTGRPGGHFLKARRCRLPPHFYSRPLRETRVSHPSPSEWCRQLEPPSRCPDSQAEKWLTWKLLPKDKTDTLPDTLV